MNWWFYGVFALTLVLVVVGAAHQSVFLVATAAGAYFTASLVRHALMDGGHARLVAAVNARAIAASYGWGSLAMLGGYYLTALSWEHDWQYGTGMALVAAALVWLSRLLEPTNSPLKRPAAQVALTALTALQGLTAIIGVVLLAASGKLTAGKPDWLANAIFISGGVALAGQSLIAVLKERRIPLA